MGSFGRMRRMIRLYVVESTPPLPGQGDTAADDASPIVEFTQAVESAFGASHRAPPADPFRRCVAATKAQSGLEPRRRR